MTDTAYSSFWAIVVVLLGHFISDFLCQPRVYAENKSKNWMVLLKHVLITGTVLTVFIYAAAGFSPTWRELYAVWTINTGSHFLIDAVTSRMTTALYKNGKIWEMFAVIGFDQFLHVSIALFSFILVTQCAQ